MRFSTVNMMSLMLGTAWAVTLFNMPMESWLSYIVVSLVIMVGVCVVINATSKADKEGHFHHENIFLFRLIEPLLKWISIAFLVGLCGLLVFTVVGVIVAIVMWALG